MRRINPTRTVVRPMPGAIGHTLRALAGWAVAASLGAASGCANKHDDDDVSQPVPNREEGVTPMREEGGSHAVGPTGYAGTNGLPSSGAGSLLAGHPAIAPTAAGNSAPEPAPPPAAAWTSPVCTTATSRPNVFASPMMLEREPDAFEVFNSLVIPKVPSLELVPHVDALGALGTSCESAADRSACAAKHAELIKPNAACTEMKDCKPFAVVDEGGELNRIEDRSDLLALIGKVNTPSEAALLAFWDGLTLGCPVSHPTKPLRGTEVQAKDGGGYTVRSEWETCGPQYRHTMEVSADGETTELQTEMLGSSGCVTGRRPAGLLSARPAAMHSPLGALFANIARLEAASVYAFERLARELVELSAPAPLVAEAVRSGLDEIRHTQLTAALAQRFGGRPAAVALEPLQARSRFEIALENAVEGCVRETYGAIVAHHQASLAQDPEVAAVMTSIAADETRHAQLSWRVAEWLEPQLDAAERDALRVAQTRAIAQLVREVEEDALPGRDARAIGWPSPSVGRALVQRMAAELHLV